MVKYNSILWLKSLKLCLFVAQLIMLIFVMATFVNVVLPPSITAASTILIGSYESELIVSNVAQGFNYTVISLIMHSLLVIDFLFMLVVIISISRHFHYDFHKRLRHHYLDLLLNTIMLICITIFIYSPLQVTILDLEVNQTIPYPINLFWNIYGSIGILNFTLTGIGIMWIIIFVVIVSAAIVNYLYLVRDIINHKYF